jgi:Xaa-Pro dipeptidase
MASKLAQVQERLAAVGTDLLALPPGSNLRWPTGADLHADERACLLLITPRDAVFLMPALEVDACRTSTDLPFETWTDAEGPGAALARIMQRFGIASAA